jgi:hypothetical protein
MMTVNFLLPLFMGLGRKDATVHSLELLVPASHETGEIVNVECVTKYFQCSETHTGQHKCLVNFEGFH